MRGAITPTSAVCFCYPLLLPQPCTHLCICSIEQHKCQFRIEPGAQSGCVSRYPRCLRGFVSYIQPRLVFDGSHFFTMHTQWQASYWPVPPTCMIWRKNGFAPVSAVLWRLSCRSIVRSCLSALTLHSTGTGRASLSLAHF